MDAASSAQTSSIFNQASWREKRQQSDPHFLNLIWRNLKNKSNKKIRNPDYLLEKQRKKTFDHFFFIQTQTQNGSKWQNCKKIDPVVFGQATGWGEAGWRPCETGPARDSGSGHPGAASCPVAAERSSRAWAGPSWRNCFWGSRAEEGAEGRQEVPECWARLLRPKWRWQFAWPATCPIESSVFGPWWSVKSLNSLIRVGNDMLTWLSYLCFHRRSVACFGSGGGLGVGMSSCWPKGRGFKSCCLPIILTLEASFPDLEI